MEPHASIASRLAITPRITRALKHMVNPKKLALIRKSSIVLAHASTHEVTLDDVMRYIAPGRQAKAYLLILKDLLNTDSYYDDTSNEEAIELRT